MAKKDIFSQSVRIIGGMLWSKEVKRQGRRGGRHWAKAWLREINIDPEAWEWSVPRLPSRSLRTENTEPRAIPRWLYRRVKRMRWMEIESLLCELQAAAGRPFWTRQRLVSHVQPAIDRLVSQGDLVLVREARRHALQVGRRLSDIAGTKSNNGAGNDEGGTGTPQGPPGSAEASERGGHREPSGRRRVGPYSKHSKPMAIWLSTSSFRRAHPAIECRPRGATVHDSGAPGPGLSKRWRSALGDPQEVDAGGKRRR